MYGDSSERLLDAILGEDRPSRIMCQKVVDCMLPDLKEKVDKVRVYMRNESVMCAVVSIALMNSTLDFSVMYDGTEPVADSIATIAKRDEGEFWSRLGSTRDCVIHGYVAGGKVGKIRVWHD